MFVKKRNYHPKTSIMTVKEMRLRKSTLKCRFWSKRTTNNQFLSEHIASMKRKKLSKGKKKGILLCQNWLPLIDADAIRASFPIVYFLSLLFINIRALSHLVDFCNARVYYNYLFLRPHKESECVKLVENFRSPWTLNCYCRYNSYVNIFLEGSRWPQVEAFVCKFFVSSG